eukprot:5917475-Alexandrium_andersonii.AAC.1
MHEVAKHHGKLRTKFERLAISCHLLDQIARGWKCRVGGGLSGGGPAHALVVVAQTSLWNGQL